MNVGQLYRYEIGEKGGYVVVTLYENRDGKEKSYDWGVAGEVIASKVSKLSDVAKACYSPTLGRLQVEIPKDVECIKSVVRAIVDIAVNVMKMYRTQIGKAEEVFEEVGIPKA